MQYYLATGSDKFLLLIVFACDLADNTWFESILMWLVGGFFVHNLYVFRIGY